MTADSSGPGQYRLYTSRWLVLLTVTLLNLSSNALWISYSAVANLAAEYFQKDDVNQVEKIRINFQISSPLFQVDLLGTISFYVGIPMCLVSSYVVDALGFRSGMFLGCGLTFLGGLTRCLSTLPGLAQHMELDTQFWLSVTGQALTGIPSKIVKLI